MFLALENDTQSVITDIMEPHWANSCSTTTSVSVAFTQPIVVPAVATTITRLPDPPIIVLNNQVTCFALILDLFNEDMFRGI